MGNPGMNGTGRFPRWDTFPARQRALHSGTHRRQGAAVPFPCPARRRCAPAFYGKKWQKTAKKADGAGCAAGSGRRGVRAQIRAATASPIARQPTGSTPGAALSAVRRPASSTADTAFSTASASFGMSKE